MELNFNSAICTSREQSERLLALGLKKETADMVWEQHSVNSGVFETIAPYLYILSSLPNDCKTPAWSLSRLIELAEVSVEVSGLWVRISSTYRYEEKDNVFDNLIDAIADLINNDVFNKEYLE